MSDNLKLRTTIVPLFQGDDLDPIADRARAVESKARVSMGGVQRMNDADPMADVVREYDEFMAAATDRAVKIGIAALGKKRFREILNNHPPRMVSEEDPETGDNVMVPHQDDADFGYNIESIGDDLLPACMIAYWVDFDEQVAAATAAGEDVPTTPAKRFSSIPECEAFLDRVADGDFSKLLSNAIGLNKNMGPDPKVRLSTLLEPTSDATSTSPERLA